MQTTLPLTMALESIARYMLAHEQDIANSVDDFGDLQSAFHALFDRLSEKQKSNSRS